MAYAAIDRSCELISKSKTVYSGRFRREQGSKKKLLCSEKLKIAYPNCVLKARVLVTPQLSVA